MQAPKPEASEKGDEPLSLLSVFLPLLSLSSLALPLQKGDEPVARRLRVLVEIAWRRVSWGGGVGEAERYACAERYRYAHARYAHAEEAERHACGARMRVYSGAALCPDTSLTSDTSQALPDQPAPYLDLGTSLKSPDHVPQPEQGWGAAGLGSGPVPYPDSANAPLQGYADPSQVPGQGYMDPGQVQQGYIDPGQDPQQGYMGPGPVPQ